jgi:hypothetical protein
MVADTEMTSTTEAAFLPDIWSRKTADAAQFKAVVTETVDKSLENEVSMGRVVHRPHRSNLTTQSKSEGVSNTVIFEAITQTNQDFTISTQEYAAWLENEVVKAQEDPVYMNGVSSRAGYALERGVEVTLTGRYDGLSQTVGVDNVEWTLDNLLRGWQYLEDAGAPEDDRFFVVSPAGAAGMKKLPELTSTDFGFKQGLRDAQIGDFMGIPVIRSQLLESGTAGKESAMYHRSALVLIRQVMPTTKRQYLIRNLADGIVIFDLYTTAENEQPAETPGSESLGDTFGVFFLGP